MRRDQCRRVSTFGNPQAHLDAIETLLQMAAPAIVVVGDIVTARGVAA